MLFSEGIVGVKADSEFFSEAEFYEIRIAPGRNMIQTVVSFPVGMAENLTKYMHDRGFSSQPIKGYDVFKINYEFYCDEDKLDRLYTLHLEIEKRILAIQGVQNLLEKGRDFTRELASNFFEGKVFQDKEGGLIKVTDSGKFKQIGVFYSNNH